MRQDTRRALSDPRLLAVRQAHLRGLEDLFAGRAPDRPFHLQGVNGSARVDPYLEPEQWVEEALDDLAASAGRAGDPRVFRPPIVEFGPYGVHFVDRILGCRVFRHEDQWWAERLDRPIGQLRAPDLDADATWRLARRLALAFVASGVALPFFAAATIASPLNVLVNLYGERVLAAAIGAPAAVRRDLRLIAEVQGRLHRWYRGNVPAEQLQLVAAAGRTQPAGYGQLCGCSTQLISAGLYLDLVAEFDHELLSVYPHGGMIHLCGVHTQHLRAWQQMPSLRAAQLNDRAAEDLAAYVDGLRDDQVIYLNPTPTMTVDRAMKITDGGRRLVLVAGASDDRPAGEPARA